MASLMVFSSVSLKAEDDIIKIPIPWTFDGLDSLRIDGARYPEEFKGFPILSIDIESHEADETKVLSIQQTVLPDAVSERLKKSIPNCVPSVTLRKLISRNTRRLIADIFPFSYDSLSDRYFRIESIEVKLIKTGLKASTAHLRTVDETGSSVLAKGTWYKIPVTKSGVYRLDTDFFQNNGIDITGINPKKIGIYGNGGGMLPQKNSEERPKDLIENAVLVSGEADGIFNKEDYVLFYGQGPDKTVIDETGALDYRKNYYSDTSFYFINFSQDDGLRMSSLEDLGSGHPGITSFDDYIVYEKDEYNIINSGREWYGEKFDFTLTYDFKFDFSELIPDTELLVTGSVMGQTYEEAGMDYFVNGISLGQQPIFSVVEGSYLAKGSIQRKSFTVNTDEIPAKDKFTLRMSFNPAGSDKSKANLNYLTAVGKRKLKLYGNQTAFRSVESTQNAISSYEIAEGSAAFGIWDITDPLKPINQKYGVSGENASFGALSGDLKEYIIFTPTEYLIPEKAVKIPNQNLRSAGNVDLLIITHPKFLKEAMRLAELRTNADGLSVRVATTDEIYNEFSSGKQDVTALRDFIKFVYEKGEGTNRLENVLLFGKGSFDYKDRIENNTNYVPTYSSRNSLHPINSYSSDDYFGFLDPDEGEWTESYSGDHLMDVGVGRLPVKTSEEAKTVVDKLIHYTADKSAFGPWRNELFFIADDGDGNLHLRDADKLSTLVDTSDTRFNVNKIYLDAFEQPLVSGRESAPAVNDEIGKAVEKGGLIFNFTGHGSATRWTEETILNITSVSEFENAERLPLFVTATCEFGRHDNPMAISGAEYLLLNPKGGAVALLTTGRPVFSSTNFILNKAFYQNVFQKEDGKYRTLGEVFRRTKNQSLNGSVNRNFSLLADPSMTLAYAKETVELIADETSYQPGDTLKALGKVKLKGQIKDANGAVNTGFSGSAFVTVFDRESEITTLGNENPPTKFLQRDNTIFKGEVSVVDGAFSAEFIVPDNITYEFDKGKISVYARDLDSKTDASGSNIEFVVGGRSDDIPSDNIPPDIRLYINDTSFVDGGITGSDILLVAKLSDESGIRITKSADGQDLSAALDGEEESILNGYYISEKDNYRSGWVTYSYKGLSTGTHIIKLKAWDVYGNPAEAEITFHVVAGEDLTIEKLKNFPNPFRDFTRFSFEHNRAGEDLEITLDVYSIQGKLVKRFYAIKENSQTRISDLVWNTSEKNGGNLAGGVYVFTLSVRSLVDGSKKQVNEKLVIIN